MIFYSKYLVPRRYLGITIFPFMILRKRSFLQNRYLINHEKIHLRQQIELLIIPFYIIYGFEFLVRLVQYRSWKLAYLNISFEREAYINEKDLNYLKSRPFWNFIRYFKK
jgi:hypothetical protein